MKKNKKYEKAFFIQRVIAYIVDMFLVMLISSLLTTPFVNGETVTKLSNESNQVIENYANGKIDAKTYFSQVIDISYEEMKVTGLANIITITVVILYFIVLQTYNNGQTLGKRLMRIKVMKNNNKDLTMNDMISRNLFTNSILADILIVTITLFGKSAYFYGSTIVRLLQYLFILITFFMIIIRKDGRGLPDMIAKTKVVSLLIKVEDEELETEEENLCES